MEVISRQIANAHTIFNLTMTVIWVGLIGLMVKIVTRIVPDGKKEVVELSAPLYLDDKMISQPAAALQLVAKEAVHLSELVKDQLQSTIEVVKSEDVKQVDVIREKGGHISELYDRINEYLAGLFSSGSLTEQQASQTASLMYILSDVDRMGNLSVEVAECIQEKVTNKYKYSSEAMSDLGKSLKAIAKMFDLSMEALQNGSPEQADKILRRKDKILDLDIKMRKAHVQRVNKGECRASLTAPFTRVLHSIDRMGNSCINLADVAMNDVSLNYFLTVEEK